MCNTDREVLSACGAAARAGGEVRSAKVLGVCGPPLTHGSPCWRGEVRSARRKGWTAAHAPLRRAVRSAAAHAARHALSTPLTVTSLCAQVTYALTLPRRDPGREVGSATVDDEIRS